MTRSKLGTRALFATLALAAVATTAGCGKKKTETTAGGAEAPALAAAGQATGEHDGVQRYGSQELAEGGTVATRTSTKVYKAADDGSTVLTTLGPGVNVDRKVRHGNWMLVLWPSGPAKLSPGWVPTSTLADAPRPGTGVAPTKK